MSISRRIIRWVKGILLIKDKGKDVFPKSKTIIISSDFSIGKYSNINVQSSDVEIIIKEEVLIRGYCSVFIEKNAQLVIDKNVFFNNYCSINCFERIEIGENTLFGEGVKLYDHNHAYKTSPNFLIERNQFKTARIKIGKNCWIGSNVTILKGVTIGDNVIIGANNLIYKSIPSNVVVKNKTEFIIERY